MTWRGKAIGACLCSALCIVRSTPAQTGDAPAAAKALVVRVVGNFQDGRLPEIGAGIILGASERELYIATARHVIKRDAAVASSIWVIFASRDSAPAAPNPSMSDSIDVALLRVAGNPAQVLRWTPASLDRLGQVRAMRADDPVYPIGCPQGVCWQRPTPADQVVGIDRLGIVFQSAFVRRGSSGGALFNGVWEVVGMVTEDVPPRANAIRIDEVLAQAGVWSVPVKLKRASVPRAGYRTTLAVSWLAPVSAKSDPYPESRLGSGRAMVVRQVRPGWAWHASLLRLAPDNLGVRAGMVGGQLILRRGRFTLAPFLEAGLGRAEGRFDAGGYYGAGNKYVPLWTQRKQDGIGVGGGLDLSAVVAPHVIVQGLAGTWSFSVPDSVPKLPSVFVGAGLRWAP